MRVKITGEKNLPKNKPNFSHASLKNLKRLGLKYVSIEKNTESAKKKKAKFLDIKKKL